jgi:hypothetical protein
MSQEIKTDKEVFEERKSYIDLKKSNKRMEGIGVTCTMQ